MAVLKYPSQQVLTADCETFHSFPDSSCICSSPFQVFPLLLLSPMTSAISLHLPSIHSFSIFLSLLLSIPVLLHAPIPNILPFQHNIFSFRHPHVFLIYSSSYCFLSPSPVTWNKQWCYDKGGAISSTALIYSASFFCLVLIVSSYQLL